MGSVYLTGTGYGPLFWSDVSRSDAEEGWPLPDEDPPAPPPGGFVAAWAGSGRVLVDGIV